MLTGEYIKNDRITEISEAVRLHNIREEKFNTNFISVLWIIPCERENATMISLLAEALRLGPAGDIKKLDERLAEMYGAVFETAVIKKGGRELLTLNMEVIKDENAGEKVFKNAASLMREIIGGRIGDKAFRQAKGRLAQILAEREDTAADYAVEKLMDMVYPNDPFSVHSDGYADDLEKISLKELNDFYDRLKSTGHTDIFISGSIDEGLALETAKGFVFRRGEINKLPADEAKAAGGCAEKTEKRNIGQSRIAAAYELAGDNKGKDYCSALILKEILCGAGSSILYDKIRQDEGLCYYIGAKLMRFRMIYVIDCGVAPGSEEKTVKLIDEGINSFRIDDRLFESAKRTVLRDIKAGEDRRSGVVNSRINEMLLGITEEEDMEKTVESVTAADVKKAAAGLKKKGVFIIAADRSGGAENGRDA